MSRRLKVDAGDSAGLSPPLYWKEAIAARIDVASEESLLKWESVLALSRHELIAAIVKFGPVVRDIRRGLMQATPEEDAA